MTRRIGSLSCTLLLMLIGGATLANNSDLMQPSPLDLQWRIAASESGLTRNSRSVLFASEDTTFKAGAETQQDLVRHKSPGKAFALSMLVPGLGQFYNGNKVKAVTFLGIEATAWILQFKWHSDGNKLTDKFEAFHEAHWSETRYGDYLYWAYTDSLNARHRDDDSIVAIEISHHLPDTRTQQYLEMTGKYDQFAWGWDDATLNGENHQHYLDLQYFPTAVGSNIPSSPNRTQYETMRYDANKKFSNARKMFMLALGNRFVSALEEFISAKRSESPSQGGSGKKGTPEFSRWKFQGKIRSVYARYDTPWVKVTYGF